MQSHEKSPQRRRAVVTGAGGFIGRSLVEHLIGLEYEVHAVVRKEPEGDRRVEGAHYIVCGMEDYRSLDGYGELKGIPLLFHFAWSGVSGTGRGDYSMQLDNVKHTLDLQEAVGRLGIRRFVHAGSIMEYELRKSFAEGVYDVPTDWVYHAAKGAAKAMLRIRCAG